MWRGYYKRWNPLPSLEGTRLYVEAVHDDWEGFRIWLSPEQRNEGVTVVRFDHQLLYCNSDEGDRLVGIENPEEVVFPHAFWMVDGSALVKEFVNQGANIRETEQILHFAFLTANECIDVLAMREPTFSGPENDA